MRIDPSSLHRIGRGHIERVSRGEAVAPTSAAQVDNAAAARGTDHVALSARAAEVQKARAALAETPEVRADRVAQLKAQIANGTYEVDPRKVAERILNPRT